MVQFNLQGARPGLFGSQRFARANPAIQRLAQLQIPQQMQQPRRRGVRGLIGGLANRLFEERDGTNFGDRLQIAGLIAQGEPGAAAALQQQFRGQAEQQQEQMREELLQRQQQQAEQQRLAGQAQQLGMDPNQFALLPEETRTELINRRFAPEQQDAQYREFAGTLYRETPQGLEPVLRDQRQGEDRDIRQDASGIARYVDTGEPVFQTDIQARQAEEQAQAQEEEARRSTQTQTALQQSQFDASQLQDLDTIIDIAERGRGVGFGAGIAAGIGGTPAANVASLLDSVTGGVALERLDYLRNLAAQSGARGSGLGQVTEREIAILRAARGALSQDMSQDQFLAQANRLRDQLRSVQAERRRILQRDFPEVFDQVYGEQEQATQDDNPLSEAEQRELEELRRRFGG